MKEDKRIREKEEMMERGKEGKWERGKDRMRNRKRKVNGKEVTKKR